MQGYRLRFALKRKNCLAKFLHFFCFFRKISLYSVSWKNAKFSRNKKWENFAKINAKKCESFAKKIISKFCENRKRNFCENSSKKKKYSFNTYGFRKIFSLQSFSGKNAKFCEKFAKYREIFFSAKRFVGYKPIVEMGLFVNERNISKTTKYYWCTMVLFKRI